VEHSGVVEPKWVQDILKETIPMDISGANDFFEDTMPLDISGGNSFFKNAIPVDTGDLDLQVFLIPKVEKISSLFVSKTRSNLDPDVQQNTTNFNKYLDFSEGLNSYFYTSKDFLQEKFSGIVN